MQKKIIALAVAGLASAGAFAQSNVTIYGIADMYVGSVNAGNGKTTTTVVNGGGLSTSRIGFKGTEDLGNGLKALFVLEQKLTLEDSTGLGASSSRQQMVGLTGGFGTAVAGYLQTTGYDWGVKFGGGLAGSALSPLQNLTTNAGIIGATNATAARLGNAVAYISPNVAGFSAAVNHSTNATTAETIASPEANTAATMVSVSYDNGPIAVGLVNAKTSTGNAATSTTDWALGGSYDFKVAKLSATYQTTETNGSISPANKTNKVYSVSLSAPVTAAGAVHLQYAKNDLATVNNADSTGYGIAYTHALSKRTTAYAGYSKMKNDNGASLTIGNNAAAYAPVAGQDPSILAAGLRHSF